MSSPLPSTWRFDAAGTDTTPVIRVIAVSSLEAAKIPGAQEKVGNLYEKLFEKSGHSVVRAKQAIASAFAEPADAAQADKLPSRTVLAYVSDQIVAYTRVNYDGERIVVSSIAIDEQLPQAVQQQVARAVVTATEELYKEMARGVLAARQATGEKKSEHELADSLIVWRGQLGASDFLKQLYQDVGFDASLTDRIEMTVYLQDVDPNTSIEVAEGFEIRALDLQKDDLVKVYDVLKIAFGSALPSFEAWKRHYPQQPRFASDLSFVAWKGGLPVAVALIELMVEGEGGGEGEGEHMFNTDGKLRSQQAQEGQELFSTTLEFADDYEERKTKIRELATVGYVCGVATLPSFQGNRLAQSVLRHSFQAAAAARSGTLKSIYLDTDRQNPAAVRTYTRAGMVETKAENMGFITAKEFSLCP